MSNIGYSSNNLSARSIRSANQHSSNLSKSQQRLSSGLRINSASDDAAGLAVASKLNSDSSVYNQAVRNVNDAISAVNIASSAVSEQANIITRIKELAEQSANGTLSESQRGALNTESKALQKEYNRIGASTKFNELNLTDGSLTQIAVQTGYGSDSSISLSLNSETQREAGTGEFGSAVTDTVSSAIYVYYDDFNNDGKTDVTAYTSSGESYLAYGAGDGTYSGSQQVASFAGDLISINSGDFTNDGYQDVILIKEDSGNFTIGKSDGSGAFIGTETVASSAVIPVGEIGDINNDGNLDVVLLDLDDPPNFYVYLGDGDGTFQAESAEALTNNMVGGNFQLSDIDSDGNLDMIGLDGSNDIVVAFGNGDGTFGSETVTTASHGNNIFVDDYNSDGKLDVLSHSGVSFGNGDGTFGETQSFGISAFYVTQIDDFNNDGITDFVTAKAGSEREIYLGDGEGNFSLANTLTSTNISSFQDVDGDGVLDAVGNSGTTLYTYLAETEVVTTLPYLDISTAENAQNTLTELDTYQDQISNEQGNLGAALSRIGATVSVLNQQADNYSAASSHITDANIASESTAAIKAQILSESSLAISAQANLMPEIALNLLKPEE